MVSSSFPVYHSFLGGSTALSPEGCSAPYLPGCLDLRLAAFCKCMFFNSNQTTRLSGHSVCCVPLPCLYLICCFSYLYITVNLQEGDKPLRSISCSFKAREHISVTGTSSLFRDFFSPNFISNCRSIDTKLYTVTK